MMRPTLKSLLKADAYPEHTSAVTLLQTHVSWIFLTDQHAYKIKKPVDFGFLNFSTIDRRRFYCNEEVRLNRRLCPDIYDGVVELRDTPAGPAFHGDGHILDYAVKMKRLPEERMLDRLLENGEVSDIDLRKVALVIADFHRNALTSPAISEFGRLDGLTFNWQENFDQMLPYEKSTLSAEDLGVIKDWVFSFISNNGELFEQRIVDGFVRECDGDIHLENICMTDQGICIFDCIEFNERFRCCDTAADIAFLLMDLDFHGRHDLAEAVISSYCEASGDRGLTSLIGFYKVYRAFVRGKVESFRFGDLEIDQHEREWAQGRAIRYFRLARGYIERSRLNTTLFVTCGLMGCGKSTLACQLAFELGIERFNSDTVRKQLAGIQPDAPVPDDYASGLYDLQHSTSTYTELLRLAESELAAGRSVIIDASFMRFEDRSRFAALAARYSSAFAILHIVCSDSENRRRLVERSTSGRSVSDGRQELFDRQCLDFEAPAAEEALIIPINSSGSPSTLTNVIYGKLASHA